MSDEIKELGAPEPRPDYVPMKDAYVPEPEKEKEISKDDLQKAASDLNEASNTLEQRPIIPREYQHIGGPQDGEAVAPNQTLSIDRAATDLTRQRDFEAAVEQQQTDESVAFATDVVRSSVQEQLQGQQPQQPPEQQPDYSQQQQAPVSDEQMLQDALSRPAIRSAMEQQLAQVEQARANYAAQAGQAFELSNAALFSAYPELNGVTRDTLQPVLNVLQRENPVRHAAIMSALYNTDRLHNQASQAKQAEAVVAAARMELYGRQQDAVMDQFVAQRPAEEQRAVKENIARVASQYYGIQPEQLIQAIRTNPGMRAAPFQRMLYETVRGHLTQEAIAAKRVPPSVRPVQRPGASPPTPSYSDEDTASALRRFNKDPNPKTASDYLNAKRAAARR